MQPQLTSASSAVKAPWLTLSCTTPVPLLGRARGKANETFKAAATALALCLVFQVQADTLLGKVINVADGDTITVLDDTHTQHKIRLAGIDAPEKR